jgi:hypothetical protein
VSRGHPDWTPIVASSVEVIHDFEINATMTGTLNTVLWTPAAGKRIRLLAYHVLTIISALASNQGTDSLQVFLEDATTGKVIDRWRAHLVLSINAQWNIPADGGFSLLPGGGWPLPVDDPLRIRTVGTTGTGVGTAAGFVSGAVFGIEE